MATYAQGSNACHARLRALKKAPRVGIAIQSSNSLDSALSKRQSCNEHNGKIEISRTDAAASIKRHVLYDLTKTRLASMPAKEVATITAIHRNQNLLADVID